MFFVLIFVLKHNICAFGGRERVSVPWESQMENRPNMTHNWNGGGTDLGVYLLGISETPGWWSSPFKSQLKCHFLWEALPDCHSWDSRFAPPWCFSHGAWLWGLLLVSFHYVEGCLAWCLAHSGLLLHALCNVCMLYYWRIFKHAIEDKKNT